MEAGICPPRLARADWHPAPSGLCPCGLPTTSVVSPCRTPASDSVPCSAPGSPLHSHWESDIISQKPQQNDSKGLGIPPPWGSCDGAPPPSPPVRPEDRPPGPHRSHNTPSSAFGSQGFPFKQDRQATSGNEIPSHSFQKPLLPPLLIWQNFLADIYSKGYPVSRLSSVPCLLGFAPWMTHLNTSCNYPLSGPCVRPTADALPSPGCLLCSAGKAACHNHQFIPPTHYTGPMRRNVCLKPVDCSELGRKPLAFPGTHIVCLSLPSCSLNAKPGLTGPHQIIWWWTAVSGILAIISITSQLSMYQILSGFTIFTQLHSQRRTILQCKKLHLPYRWEYWSSGNRCWAQEGLGLVGDRCGVQSSGSAWVSSQRHSDSRETSFLWIAFLLFSFFPTNSREYIQSLTFFDLLCHILKNCSPHPGTWHGGGGQAGILLFCLVYWLLTYFLWKVSTTLREEAGKGRDSRRERKQVILDFLNQYFLHL